MNSINQNYLNNYDLKHNNIGFRSENHDEIQNVQIPDMYYTPEYKGKPKTFKEKVRQWDMLGLVYQWLEHPILMLGTCAGLSYAIDSFDRACNKEYDKSILGKAAKFGDKIEKSKLVQSEPMQKCLGGISKGWDKIKTTAMKSNIIKSMVETPSQPENEMPKSELKRGEHRIVSKFKELSGEIGLTEPYADNEGSMIKMKTAKKAKLTYKDLYLNKDELANLKKIYGDNLSKASQEELVNRVMLQRIGKSEAEITGILSKGNVSAAVREELFKASGLTKEELEQIINDQNGESAKLVKKASKNLKNIKINNGKIKLPGSYQPFANISSFEGIYNRLHSVSDGAKTNTGRFMSKAVQKFHRGMTWGGGKTMVLFFVGPMILEAFLNTKKADKKEKVGTLACGIIEPTTWVITFPLVLKAIYAYGGIQYAGMGKEKVDEYRNLVKEFNKKADAKLFKDKAAYKTARKELDKKLKTLQRVDNENLLTMVLRKISHWTKWDLEKIRPYQNENALGNILRKIPNFFKNLHGFPGRFLVFMLVGMPILDKAIKKILNLIFGKSYDYEKEEENKANKEQQEIFAVNDLRTRLQEAQYKKLHPEINATAKEASIEKQQNQTSQNQDKTIQSQNESDITKSKTEQTRNIASVEVDNALDNDNKTAQKESAEPVKDQTEQQNGESKDTDINNQNKTQNNSAVQNQANTTKPQQTNIVQPELQTRDNYTYIPSQDSVFNQNKPEENGKYIPAQTPANITKTFDNSRLESVLQHASRAEQKAINVLAGNFENM